MANITSSDVAISLDARDRHILGKLRMSQGSLAFGDGALTYPYGGVPMPAIGGFGMNKEVSMFDIVDASGDGLIYRYDQANRKIKVFAPAPPIVYDEKHTLAAATTVTLDYPAALIFGVQGVNTGYQLTDGGATLAAGECSFTPAAGVRTVITFQAAVTGDVYISYVTQAWKEVWDNLVTGEAVTTATHVNELANNAVAIQSFRASAAGTAFNAMQPTKTSDTAGATTEVLCDFTPGTGKTKLTSYATDAVTAAVVSYVKIPSSGFLATRFIEEEDVTIGGDAGTTAYPILFPSICGGIPDFTNANEEDPYYMMMRSADDCATARECKIDWRLKTATGTKVQVKSTASDAVAMSYVHGYVDEIPGVVPLELRDATIIQATTLRYIAWGK